MFLKGVTEKIRHKSSQKYLNGLLVNPPPRIQRSKGVKRIGCVVDMEMFDDVKAIQRTLSDGFPKGCTVKLIGYHPNAMDNSPYGTPMFTDADLGWGGKIENTYVQEFLAQEYDLLINYHQGDRLILQLVALETQAGIKAGFASKGPELNDLMFAMDPLDCKAFGVELKKYLEILKEI